MYPCLSKEMTKHRKYDNVYRHNGLVVILRNPTNWIHWLPAVSCYSSPRSNAQTAARFCFSGGWTQQHVNGPCIYSSSKHPRSCACMNRVWDYKRRAIGPPTTRGEGISILTTIITCRYREMSISLISLVMNICQTPITQTFNQTLIVDWQVSLFQTLSIIVVDIPLKSTHLIKNLPAFGSLRWLILDPNDIDLIWYQFLFCHNLTKLYIEVQIKLGHGGSVHFCGRTVAGGKITVVPQ